MPSLWTGTGLWSFAAAGDTFSSSLTDGKSILQYIGMVGPGILRICESIQVLYNGELILKIVTDWSFTV